MADEGERPRLHVGPDLALLDPAAARRARRPPARAAAFHADDDPRPRAGRDGPLGGVAEGAQDADAARGVDDGLALGHARAPPPGPRLLAMGEGRLEEGEAAGRRRVLEEDVQGDGVLVEERARRPRGPEGPRPEVARRPPVAPPVARVVDERAQIELDAVPRRDLEREGPIAELAEGRALRRGPRARRPRRRRRLGRTVRRRVVAAIAIVEIVVEVLIVVQAVVVLLRARLRLAPRAVRERRAAPRVHEVAPLRPGRRAPAEVEERAVPAPALGVAAPPPPAARRPGIALGVLLADDIRTEVAVRARVVRRLRAVARLAVVVTSAAAAGAGAAVELVVVVIALRLRVHGVELRAPRARASPPPRRALVTQP